MCMHPMLKIDVKKNNKKKISSAGFHIGGGKNNHLSILKAISRIPLTFFRMLLGQIYQLLSILSEA